LSVDHAHSSEAMNRWLHRLHALFSTEGMPTVPVFTQSILGALPPAFDGLTNCKTRLEFFKQRRCIPSVCFACFKLQILCSDVLSHNRLYCLLRFNEQEPDLQRKCMIEIRQDVKFPYKGYIFCSSEPSAKHWKVRLQKWMEERGISGVCRITHGCSEYGISFEQFRYQEDGRHRLFKPSSDWINNWSAFATSAHRPSLESPSFNNVKALSLRDCLAMVYWLNYGVGIGDLSTENLDRSLLNSCQAKFTRRVHKQSKRRFVELQEIQALVSTNQA
ncbi:MAG: hypothetical protein VX278_20860, partial [Myxococcota bacterium]|nr:hypothetical protein [Myxococcota bacterium]